MPEAFRSDTKRTERPRCAGTTKSGARCRSFALPNDSFCFSHSPSMATRRDEARRRGGANSSNAKRLQALLPHRLRPVFIVLERALEEVHSGSLTPAQAQAMSSVARALCAVLSSGEFEERLRRLELEVEERG